MEDYLRIRFPLLKDNNISLFPHAPHYSQPQTFPYQNLLGSEMHQVKVNKVRLQILMLGIQNSHPSKT